MLSRIFRTPDVEACLCFAAIILTGPPTFPAKYPDQIVYGLIAAVTSFAVFEGAGVVYYLLAGLLAANVWEAWRRVRRSTRQTSPGGTAPSPTIEHDRVVKPATGRTRYSVQARSQDQ